MFIGHQLAISNRKLISNPNPSIWFSSLTKISLWGRLMELSNSVASSAVRLISFTICWRPSVTWMTGSFCPACSTSTRATASWEPGANLLPLYLRSGHEKCVPLLANSSRASFRGDAYQQNREMNGAFQKHLYHHHTILKRCVLSLIVCLACGLRRVETESRFLRMLYYPGPRGFLNNLLQGEIRLAGSHFAARISPHGGLFRKPLGPA